MIYVLYHALCKSFFFILTLFSWKQRRPAIPGGAVHRGGYDHCWKGKRRPEGLLFCYGTVRRQPEIGLRA